MKMIGKGVWVGLNFPFRQKVSCLLVPLSGPHVWCLTALVLLPLSEGS